MKKRGQLRIGIPRVLNMYAYAPLFSSYLESLGLQAENIVYSDFTSGEMYRAGSSRGSIDPCYPSKITIAHVHNLIFNKHSHKPLQVIFFPMFDVLASPLVSIKGHNACPTVSVTPETVEAAFTKETDVFSEHDIRYVHPLVNLSDHKFFARQMFQAWAPILGLSEEENKRAIEIGFRELGRFESSIRRRAREVLDQLESHQKLGIVMLGRPYHHDPGVNHEILEQFQKLGYPVFSQSTLPLDEDLLGRLFGGLAWETVHHLQCALSKILGTAVEWGYIEANPVRMTRLPRRRRMHAKAVLTPVQLKLLAARLPEPSRSLVVLLMLTGLRIGELLALRWRHVDLAAALVRVEETVYEGHFDEPKSRHMCA